MNRIISWLKIKFKRYKCCCCGRRLKTSEIACIGPEVLVWCEDCKGAARVYQQIWLEEKMDKIWRELFE